MYAVNRMLAAMINLRTADPDSMPNGRYLILSILSRGDFGTIYYVRDLVSADRLNLALKKIHVENGKLDDLSSQHFVAESRRFQDFRHPVLPRIFDYFIERDEDHKHRNFYVAMDYINGRDFDGIVSMMEKPIPYPQLKKWAIELWDALATMHAESIYFGLLCPRHIMTNHHGQIRLVDLGIGSSLNAGNNAHLKYYLPPDASPAEPSAADDIYSLGATLYHLVTRLKPTALDEVRTPSMQALTANSNASYADIIMKALEHKPANRFQSIEQMRATFMELS